MSQVICRRVSRGKNSSDRREIRSTVSFSSIVEGVSTANAMVEQKPGAKVALFANVVLIGGGIACLAVLAYFGYFYAWSGTRHFNSVLGPLLYYVAPAILSLLLFGALRLSSAGK